MEDENYISTTIWLRDEKTAVTNRSFNSGYYLISFGLRAGSIATPHLEVLEGIRDAANKLIAKYKEREDAEAESKEEAQQGDAWEGGFAPNH